MMYAIKEKPAATLLSFLQDFVAYNSWANKTLAEWLSTKPASLVEQDVISSFPSLKLTLLHIWDCQRFWLSVLEKKLPPVSFRDEYHGTLDEIFEGIVEQSEKFADYVATLSEAALNENCYFGTPWIDGTCPRFEFIHHCMNHGTYHRGQLITISRNVGLTDPPMTDYAYYLLVVKNQQSLFAPAMAI